MGIKKERRGKTARVSIVCAVATSILLVSCIKDEPLNSECDITDAYVSVNSPGDMFFQVSDTLVHISSEESTIRFTVRRRADLTRLSPRFIITNGAAISPASGSTHDFSQGPVTYTVTSQDGQWSRQYQVSFQPVTVTVTDTVKYDFEHYGLDDKYQRFYEWYEKSDGTTEPDADTPGTAAATERLWATGNSGFFLANSSKAAEDYPTVPCDDGFDGKCVKLTTLDTGPLGRSTGRPIAAGNLFLGYFNTEKALRDALHATEMGVPFTHLPHKLTGYYRYQPGQEYKNKTQEVLENRTDSADVYAVLYRNHDETGRPVVLYGDNVLTSPLIVSKARVGNLKQTSEWTFFEKVFEQTGEVDEDLLGNRGYNLALVFSSSINGASFEGAIGSTLYIDKVRVICTHNE